MRSAPRQRRVGRGAVLRRKARGDAGTGQVEGEAGVGRHALLHARHFVGRNLDHHDPRTPQRRPHPGVERLLGDLGVVEGAEQVGRRRTRALDPPEDAAPVGHRRGAAFERATRGRVLGDQRRELVGSAARGEGRRGQPGQRPEQPQHKCNPPPHDPLLRRPGPAA
jgi:hypothetical protein